MNSISAIPAALPIAAGQLPAAVDKVGASSLLAPVTSAVSGVGASGDTTSTAGLPGMSDAMAPPPLWENKSRDLMSSLMAVNYASQSLAARFKGLGATLLKQFALDGRDVSQTVRQAPPGTRINSYGAVFSLPQASLHGRGENQISFTVATKSGVQVQMTLDSQADGLAVRLKADGTLSDAERAALDKLSGVFESAIGGLTQDPPRLKLDGLTQFDPAVFKSVDLQATLHVDGNADTESSLSFHADAAQRKVSYSGAAGMIDVGVDMSEVAALDGKAQQAKAVANYLKQFDSASARGHADADLMAMFKDAFVTLHANVDGRSAVASAMHGPMTLTQSDHEVLTGLADFNASVKQTEQASNPAMPGEKDTFSYEVSQNTSVTGSQRNRSITQQQQSRLTASYHLPAPGAEGDGMASQSYDYYRIDDSASSTAQLSYADGMLVKATLDQSVDRSTRVASYLLGKLISDVATPTHEARHLDLALDPTDAKTTSGSHLQQMRPGDINDGVFLQA